jgi:hypothetical protein
VAKSLSDKSAGRCKVSSYCCTSNRQSSANRTATVRGTSAYVTGESSSGKATSVESTLLATGGDVCYINMFYQGHEPISHFGDPNIYVQLKLHSKYMAVI